MNWDATSQIEIGQNHAKADQFHSQATLLHTNMHAWVPLEHVSM